MPPGFFQYFNYENFLEHEPEKLADEYLAFNVSPEKPIIPPDLAKIYKSARVKITEPQETSNHPIHFMLLGIQAELRFQAALDYGSREQRKTWRPVDWEMQRFVWMFIRFSMWDGMSWLEGRPHKDRKFLQELLDDILPRTIPIPTTPQYYVHVGTNKILVSLARELHLKDLVRMEVAKVVHLTPTGTVQDACIISLNRVVIVNINKTSSKVRVKHTPPLRFDWRHPGGIKALIATFSPLESYSAPLVSKTLPSLPAEIIEDIFKFLSRTSDRTTISNFACVCKSFSKMVRSRTVKLDRCLVTTFPTKYPKVYYGFDEKGKRRLFLIEDNIVYQPKKKCISVNALADGLNLGLSMKYHWTYILDESAFEDTKVN
jgi:hypothetical protein